jgi:uncharacterized protein
VNRGRALAAAMRERGARGLLWIYKRALAPALHASVPGACCFQPTCSEYAAIAMAEHGVLRGGAMAAWRVLRCHPLNRGGFDPVPARRRPNAGLHEWKESQIQGISIKRQES